MSQPEAIKELFEKFIANQCNASELQQLMDYFAAEGEDADIDALIRDELEKESESDRQLPRLRSVVARVDRDLFEQIHQMNPQNKVLSLWPRFVAAASVILVLSAAGYYFLHQPKDKTQVTAKNIRHDVPPGGNKAYLTLGNGQRISLTDAGNGTIAREGNKTIRKTADGMILYDNLQSDHTVSAISYNTIETPRGGQYQVVLPDGSKVWLNAASSLKYPAEFTGADRQVELTGEAYFEVAKDKSHPFKVKTDRQTVEVLGTHFDINGYTDEPALKTTLLEGSVKIITRTAEQTIRPGEQARLAQNEIAVKEVNVDRVVAWKNGYYRFSQESIPEIMRQIARWYDIEVIYDKDIPQTTLSGTVSRYRNISQVLNMLEKTQEVRFKVEGRKVYVSK